MTSSSAPPTVSAAKALTKACQVLTGIITGIIADGELHDKEILMLNTWLRANAQVTETWPGNAIARLIQEALADGRICEEERQHLLTELQAIVGNDFCESGAVDNEVAVLPFDPEAQLETGMRVCFTGVFVYGTRSACEKLACKQGLEPMSGVSKKVHALIVGTHISPDWANTSYGRKIMRAMELRESGHDIRIVQEQVWLESLKNLLL
ncbi:BRCT domain-containing protein [Comamonas kerstersii]|uniref:BRCT domain-containing protein n=1 Tax=Comamonas kerstersii TaxID=225992 RepID=UPI00266C364D|nr:BRCT domain-containing protein [Comamonas kerstersii]